MIVDIHAHPVSANLVRDPRNLSMMRRQAACLADTDAPSLLLERMNISALPAIEPRMAGPLLAVCVDRGLGDRLLFGSDFPLVDPAGYARKVSRLGPNWLMRRLTGFAKFTPQVRSAILGGNAVRLLKLAEAQGVPI